MKYFLYFLLISFLLISPFFMKADVLAQSSAETWSKPVNLSHSGSATNPVMVVSPDGVVHVFWTDEFGGPMYARRDGEVWSNPIQVNVPFKGYIPQLLADSQGYLHAFWVDREQVLRYANINASAIPNSSWNPIEVLAASAVALDVKIDNQDRFYLTYLRVVDLPDQPAGVYFRRSEPQAISWSDPTLLYQSLYFRTIDAKQAHLGIDVANPGSANEVFVTWDNRPRSRVFLARSEDGGQSWSEPVEIDKPEQGGGSNSPSNLTVYAQDSKVLLVWQNGNQEAGCTLYYQWSLDDGLTWQPHQHFSNGFFGCEGQYQILERQGGPILVLAATQVYLQAWDGTRWSEAQTQNTLTSFVDPETRQSVGLSCLQPTLLEDQLFIVGCTAGDKGGDIWWLQRGLSDVADWFPKESLWQPLTLVTQSDSRFLSLALIADTQERLHLIWSQGSGDPIVMPDSALYYSRWEGEKLWSQPVSILASPEEPADQPAVALDHSGRLLVVWRRGDQGEIVFSYASANQAVLPSVWSEPQRLSASGQSTSAPAILVSADGEIYVVYAVPVNEERGIYLTHSEDGGETWSDPAMVFDGASAGWTMLDQPSLALDSNGGLHLLWVRYELRTNIPVPSSLVYANSQDGGKTWTEPETVVDNSVVWSRLLGTSEGILHRFWQEVNTDQTRTLWHERSLDNGNTWERIAPIFIFGVPKGNPRLLQDRSVSLHLLQIVSQDTDTYRLQHWIWSGDSWGGKDNLDLNLESNTSIGDMASAVSPQGKLAVILSGQYKPPGLATQQEELFFTVQNVELPNGLPTWSLPTLITPVVTTSSTIEPTLPPTLTPTPDLAVLNANGGTPDSTWKGLMIGGLLAGFFVAVAFGIGVWRVRISK